MKLRLTCTIAMLLYALTTAAEAEVLTLDCKLTSVTGNHAPTDSPSEKKLAIDVTKQVVTDLGDCSSTTYSNSSDPETTGHESRCALPKDPFIRLWTQRFIPQGRHIHRNEKYHVEIATNEIEWGLDAGDWIAESKYDVRTKTLSLTQVCRNCISVWSWLSVYHCKSTARR